MFKYSIRYIILEDGGISMGTDMTVFLEVRSDSTKSWHHVTKTMSDRCYEMFARIGGVRGDMLGNDEYHNRGIPKDMNDWDKRGIERKLAEGVYHNPTYYTYRELKDTVLNFTCYDEDFGEIKFDMDTIMGCDLLAWKYMVKALAKKYGKDNVRFVFLFDS